MRFLVMVKANPESEAGVLPTARQIEEMSRYNAELVAAGVLLTADGLRPSADGARVQFDGARRTVVDGPFAETKELVAGFSILEVDSVEEVLEWVKRCPNVMPGGVGEIEVRRLYEPEDFADTVTPEVAAIADGVGTLRRPEASR